MTPVEQLRRIINRQTQAQQGTVVAVTTAGITVSTINGHKLLRRESNDATAYRVNDRVNINGQFVAGRVASAPEVYVL